MTLCVFPRQGIERRKQLPEITSGEKEIGIDSARCLINIDGRGKEIQMEGDGYCGSFMEIYVQDKKELIFDSIVICLSFPDSFDIAKKKIAGYLFGDMKQLSLRKQKNKEDPSR